jgi:hypothetical protein
MDRRSVPSSSASPSPSLEWSEPDHAGMGTLLEPVNAIVDEEEVAAAFAIAVIE